MTDKEVVEKAATERAKQWWLATEPLRYALANRNIYGRDEAEWIMLAAYNKHCDEESEATIRSLVAKLDEARSHLACAIIQAPPSDDQIVMNHVRDAKEIVDAALAQARRGK